ncbi:L-arabinose isomerase 2, partial [Dissostichus eleginoides]
ETFHPIPDTERASVSLTKSLSAPPPQFVEGECWVEADGGEMRGCVWALEPLVTGLCQVRSAAGPTRELTRNAVILSVVKDLWTLGKKSKCLCRKTQMDPSGYVSSALWFGRFKAA